MIVFSLEDVNANAPYKVEEAEAGEYVFQTCNGVIYGIGFLEDTPIGECETYQLTISNKNDRHGVFDPDVRVTIFAIVEEFFQRNSHVLIYICDTSDGRESVRNRLFMKWFEQYADKSRFYFKTAHASIEGEGFYAAVIAENSNPNITLIKADFERTAGELAKP